jgi:hypothetical protein
VNDEERKIQVKKKAENKKTASEKRIRMKNIL